MRRTGERRWQPRVEVTLCGIELGLGEKDAAAEVSAAEVSPDEVGPSAVDAIAPGLGSHELARAKQDGIDVSPVCGHVQFHKIVGAAVREALGLVERQAELTVERAGRS